VVAAEGTDELVEIPGVAARVSAREHGDGIAAERFNSSEP
jgi:hypothetical protein